MAKRLGPLEKDIPCAANEIVSSSQLAFIDDFNFNNYLGDFDQLTESSLCAGFMHPNQNTADDIIYRNPSRLPDSPPITEISGAGSSGSPTSTEPPYSPENYRNYRHQGMHGPHQMPGGVILGISDLPPNIMVTDESMMQSHQNTIGNRALGNMPSPPDYNRAFTPQAPSSTITQDDTKEHLQGTQVYEFMPVSSPSHNLRHMGSYQAQNVNYPTDERTIYNNMTNITSDSLINRKRMRHDPPNDIHHNTKQETPKIVSVPGHTAVAPLPAVMDETEDTFHQQAIKFTRFNEESWAALHDCGHRQLNQLDMCVVADKGFNYSTMDNCFVNQKKNHFQISVHIGANDDYPPYYVRVGNELKIIHEFRLAFCGVKSEILTSEIQIKQSTTDRRPVPHDPVSLKIEERRMTKVTVPRLHFSETTMNNQRKNGRPNPDQKYFLLVVRLMACTADGQEILVQAYHSERVIVRVYCLDGSSELLARVFQASNPGQFEPPDTDATWQKNGTTLYYYNGSVAIGTDRAIAPLTVNGDIYCAGNFLHPSDLKLKEKIQEVDTKDAMSRLSQIRVVGYSFKPEIADKWGLTEASRHRVGVIAQELAEILPEAVTDNGDFLQVDDTRIFYETVAAATELCRLTGTLEQKIATVEKISQRLTRLIGKKRDVGSMASGLSDLGLSDRSLMASRASLDSSTTNKSYIRSNRNRCRATSSGTYSSHPSQMCKTTHYAQKTVPYVMIAMLICIVLMTGLYLFDWYGRTFPKEVPYAHELANQRLTYGDDVVDNVVQLKNFTGFGFVQNVLPIHLDCDHNFCKPHCCGNSSSSSSLSFIISHHRDSLPQSALFPIPLPSGLNIEILTVNITLDERYCMPDSCVADLGSYTLFVPISPYMPTIPLEVKLSTPDKSSFVDSCGSLPGHEFHEKGCSQDRFYDLTREYDAKRVVGDVYEVLVGNRLQSAYRFRVGYSTFLCMMDESQRGKTFDEYNIVFYRQCVK